MACTRCLQGLLGFVAVYSIRKADPKDAPEIATVHIAAWKEAYRGIVPDDFLENLSVQRRTEQWVNSLSDVNHLYHHALIAEVNGHIVGFSNFGFPQKEDDEFDGELYAIYLLKSAQKFGIGRALFVEAANSLMQMGSTSMLVWVLKDNPSRGFYEHLNGVYLREKMIEIGGSELVEAAYGWRDLNLFQRG
ncbi:MAG: GNAT family N-acetyltransferase [Anaerolineales bacterium]|nr:GNAT family N-acetyltransferase [Anaerolineales bacterium]